MTGNRITWNDIDGIDKPDAELTYLFESAGLCKQSASTAAAALSRGHYSTFEEAAIAEFALDPDANALATDARIATAAARLDPPETSAFGRVVVDVQESLTPWGRPLNEVKG
jgi:hypothetical protein